MGNIVATLFSLPVLYALSEGPAWMLVVRFPTRNNGDAFYRIYGPLNASLAMWPAVYDAQIEYLSYWGPDTVAYNDDPDILQKPGADRR